MRRCGGEKSRPLCDRRRHLVLVGGYIVEVQVHMEQIMMRKKEGHEHYGYFREYCRECDVPARIHASPHRLCEISGRSTKSLGLLGARVKPSGAAGSATRL